MGVKLSKATEYYTNRKENGPATLLHRNIRQPPSLLVRASGNTYTTANGEKVFDASGGAAVMCLGRKNKQVRKAIDRQRDTGVEYVCSLSGYVPVAEDLAQFLVRSTDCEMTKVIFYNSGSEGTEGAKKLTIQYHAQEKTAPEPSRTLFIARDRSYHGATLGALATSGHRARKDPFAPVMANDTHYISPCYYYREGKEGESEEDYVARLKEELRNKFIELGPKNVAGFFCEPIVGAALGCVPALPGYLNAMKEVCREFGALFIVDEVMCGMGRSGYRHAWQEEGVAPDLQIVGKCLAGGFEPLSAILIGKMVAEALGNGSGVFNHGHTFQNFAPACAAGLEVQKIIDEQHLLQNVREKGERLAEKLKNKLGSHPHVGDIRGNGLFRGIELVEDKATKKPFSPKEMTSFKLHLKGLQAPYCIHIYPGSGTVDGIEGDHIIIAPAFNINNVDVDQIANKLTKLINDFFTERESSMNTKASL